MGLQMQSLMGRSHGMLKFPCKDERHEHIWQIFWHIKHVTGCNWLWLKVPSSGRFLWSHSLAFHLNSSNSKICNLDWFAKLEDYLTSTSTNKSEGMHICHSPDDATFDTEVTQHRDWIAIHLALIYWAGSLEPDLNTYVPQTLICAGRSSKTYVSDSSCNCIAKQE
jgi:hypothetical protein